MFRMPRPLSTSSPRLNIKEGWVDPKLGWCTDMKAIERRTKELDKAKAKDVYKKYIAGGRFYAFHIWRGDFL